MQIKTIDRATQNRTIKRGGIAGATYAFFALILVLFSSFSLGGQMEPTVTVVEQKGFTLVGIEVRTNNKNEMSGDGKIGPLWEKFYAENILAKIPNQTNPGTILSLYTNYESDVNGDYSVIIGAQVSEVGELTDDLIVKEIPDAKYAVFTSAKGSIPEIVIGTWKHIYTLQEGQIGYNRSYSGDFEIYDHRAGDAKNAVIEIHLSID